MRIQINPSLSWGAVFTVPAVVVDKYLKLSSPEQMQTLLWVLRHVAEQPTEETIASALHKDVSAICEYLYYWQQNGILELEGAQAVIQTVQISETPVLPEVPATENIVSPKKQLEDLPKVKPTQAQILQRTSESSEISYLFDEAQKKFGRTLGYDGQCTLLMCIDYYGLPVEVVLMIIEYCAEVNKTANSYISAMAKSWAEEEIDTIFKAEEKIIQLRKCISLWKALATSAGLSAPYPTAVQSEFLRSWSSELGYSSDMIALAYEEMANHCTKLSFAYMNKVLRNWHKNGYKTPEEVAEANRLYREKKKADKKSDSDETPASYDIQEMEHHLMHGPIVYKKND